MSVQNIEVAEIFDRLATLLEIEGANAFRVRAYRNAARTIQDLPHSVAGLLAEGKDLAELSGIGEDLAGKIARIVETGRLEDLDEIERRVPGELAELTEIAGLGPKRVKAVYERLGVRTLDDLAKAARDGKLGELPGFGARTADKILKEIGRLAETSRRMKLLIAEQVAEPLLDALKRVEGVEQAVIAGSYRRRKETVGDLDILVACADAKKVMDRFVGYEEVSEVISHGTTRSSVRLRAGLQVDVRVVPEESYGAALHYFTGSKAHNIAVRGIGVKKGYKTNEYGVFKGDERIAGRTEEEVFAAVDLPYIEPELRESWGEIEAAQQGRLPKLITLADIRGDLHTHTKASDGKYTAQQMAEAAREKGYDYFAVSDHSKRVTVARGLDEKRLAQQIDELDRLNDELDGIRILKSCEVDILDDGRLDLPDSILERLDLRVCSIHYHLDLPGDKQTERVLRAMDNPYFNIMGHPTGRLIGSRDGYPLDMERIMQAALERGCFLELNAQPHRLDLCDVHCKMAKEMGLKVAISTDSHSINNLDYMRFGIDQARRGWLEPADVLNTRSWAELKKLLARH